MVSIELDEETVERLDGLRIEDESYDEVETDFLSGELHPADLKPSAAAAISDVIDPVRERLADEDDLLAEAYPEKYGAE